MTNKLCTHCGECCLAITCALGQAIFIITEDAICPAIETESDLYYCGLINNTSNYMSNLVGSEPWKVELMHNVFVKLIGIGIGCTNGERTGEEHKIDKTFLNLLQETTMETPI